jgi:hypothetical protein
MLRLCQRNLASRRLRVRIVFLRLYVDGLDKSNEQHYEMAETMFTLRSVKAISSMTIEVVTHFNNRGAFSH